MKVLLWADMEGVAQIANHRECWPAFAEYWRSGRPKFTSDVVAAAAGLLAGGAHAVEVVNGHGLGWPNLLVGEFPPGATMYARTPFRDFDALFQVGFHARCGTNDGFISHTFVPRFAVMVDGLLYTESHAIARRTGLPLLGITGDAVLGQQLEGAIAETPFLAVKRSTSRDHTTPTHATPSESFDAIRQFALGCARDGAGRPPPQWPALGQIAVALDEDLVPFAAGQSGLEPQRPGVLLARVQDWQRQAEPALNAGMAAAVRPLAARLGGLAFTNEAQSLRQDAAQLAQLRAYFDEWVSARPPSWPT